MIDIIPAIDIIEGKCVRLTQGDYEQKKVYNENPLEVALQFQDAGISRLHLVDLDGAKASKIVNWKVLEQISSKTNLFIDFGGGVKSDDDIRIAFECGAKQVTGGSIAVKNESLFLSFLEHYGADKIILGADVKNKQIAVSGWQESTQLDIIGFLENYVAKGIKHVICTDISKDGLLQGPSFELYKEVLGQFNDISLIASGGITTLDDVIKLDELGLRGAIIGKALYEGKIKLSELTKLML